MNIKPEEIKAALKAYCYGLSEGCGQWYDKSLADYQNKTGGELCPIMQRGMEAAIQVYISKQKGDVLEEYARAVYMTSKCRDGSYQDAIKALCEYMEAKQTLKLLEK